MRSPRRRFCTTVSLAPALAAMLTVPRPAPGAPGELDPSFGGGTGWVHSPGSIDGAVGMAVQPDGKILLTGEYDTSDGASHMTVWRCHPDGSPDISFNGTGRTSAPPASTVGDAVLVLSDGRILLTGKRVDPPVFYIAVFLPDGQPDISFGPGQSGLISLSNFGPNHPAVLQPDGKILIAASGFQPLRIMRLLPNGITDPSFGSGGIVNIPDTPFGSASCNAVSVQSDGKILLARNDEFFSVTRLLPGGMVDVTFGSGGSGTAHLNTPGGGGTCRAVNALPDGKILAAGEYPRTSPPPNLGFLFARFLPNGLPDPSFGEAATPGRTLMFADGAFFRLLGMAVQSDGRILAAGAAGGLDIALARLTADGLPDNLFGVAGRVRTDIGNEFPRAAALLPEQKLLVCGAVGGPTGPESLLVRYHAQVPAHLSVEYPPGIFLPASPPAAVNFGPVTAGTRIVTLTLRNTGLNPLTNLQAVITDESIPGDYQTAPPAAATLAPGAATTVLLRLTPSTTPGLRTATLRLTADNVNPSLPPRLVPLTGSKATPLQIWRVTWFGSPDNSGPGADANDFDHDGLPNFMEYATRSHPHLYTHDPCQPAGGGQFTYTRPAAALTEFSYEAESAPSPAGPWSAAGLTSVVLTDDGTVQTVRVSAEAETAGAPRMFLRLRVTGISDQ